MHPSSSIDFKKIIDDIHALIRKSLQDNFLTDKTYIQITTKIGLIDEYLASSEEKKNDPIFLSWSDAKLNALSKILIDIQSSADKSVTLRDEDLMHPTGDYYNEDNSIPLSEEIKNRLKKILEEKVSEH